MSFKITIDSVADSLKDLILAMDQPVRAACSAAIKVAGTRTLYYGQQDINRAGLGAKLTSAWHVKFFPQGGKLSIDAAAWAYHKIPFVSIFESGGTIHGKPFLWIPLRNAPSLVSRGRATPKRLAAKGIKLFSIERAGKPPLLATKVYESQGRAKNADILKTNVTLGSLLKSKNSDRHSKQVRVTVPLFFGIQSVTIQKKLHLVAIAQAERDALPEYYIANLQV